MARRSGPVEGEQAGLALAVPERLPGEFFRHGRRGVSRETPEQKAEFAIERVRDGRGRVIGETTVELTAGKLLDLLNQSGTCFT
ncbi:MAG: hypothetical protein AB7L66_01285 [Gemmatimonadales bacterium]